MIGVVVTTALSVAVVTGSVGRSHRVQVHHVANVALRETTRSVEVGDVTWTVSRSESEVGPCIGVTATFRGREEGTIGGGCGNPDDPDLRWGIGGLDVGGRWFNVAYGAVSPTVRVVEVTLGDGTIVSDHLGPDEGVWILPVAADPLNRAFDVVRISARDGGDAVVAEEEPPSLVKERQQAQQLSTQGEVATA
jgi:hypothetical protein